MGMDLDFFLINFYLYYVQILLLLIVINFSKSISLLFALHKNVKTPWLKATDVHEGHSSGGKRRRDGYERNCRYRIEKTWQLITFGTKKEASEKLSWLQSGVTRWIVVPLSCWETKGGGLEEKPLSRVLLKGKLTRHEMHLFFL